MRCPLNSSTRALKIFFSTSLLFLLATVTFNALLFAEKALPATQTISAPILDPSISDIEGVKKKHTVVNVQIQQREIINCLKGLENKLEEENHINDH